MKNKYDKVDDLDWKFFHSRVDGYYHLVDFDKQLITRNIHNKHTKGDAEHEREVLAFLKTSIKNKYFGKL